MGVFVDFTSRLLISQPAPFPSVLGRCFSAVGEFLIPARTREKEGEKGKRRREKKEERDMRLPNYEYK